MDLTFLGTGAGKPSLRRNVTSMALGLLQEGRGVWLFDCGEATQHQIMRSKVSLHKIEAVFITHLHGDHIFGLPGLLSSRSLLANPQRLSVYGPAGIKAFLDTVLRLSGTHLSYPLHIIEVEPGMVFQDAQFTVHAQSLAHRVPSFGYRIEQADQPGALDVNKLKRDGIAPGVHFQKIKCGQTVQLDDGRVVDGAQYAGTPIPGKVIAIFGDTAPTDNALVLGDHADVLVHEATMAAALTEKANNLGHSSTIQAAQLARQCAARQLIITHISSRYQVSDEANMLEECRAIFPHTDIAHDLQTFVITR